MSTSPSPSDPDPTLSTAASTKQRHTQHTGLRPRDAYNLLTSPQLPILTQSSPIVHHARAHFLLLAMFTAGLLLAHLFGLEILQTRTQMVSTGAAIYLGFGLVGGWGIDWWHLVLGYWWFSMPVAGAVGVLYLVLQERATGIRDTD